MYPRYLAPTIILIPLLGLALACADRTTIPMEEDETGPPPGEPFSGCIDEDDCFVEWCLHPAGEAGFCTSVCEAGPDSCEPAPGGTATATCLPVDGDEVCALDCGSGKSCPPSMRCEQIEANGQARAICF